MKNNKLMSIPLDKIIQSENSRQVFNDTEMAELMVSMKHVGLLQPVGVTKIHGKDEFALVFGFRRVLAAEKLGWTEIDCILTESKDEEDTLIKNAIENVQRASVSFAEQGRIFAYLVKQGLTPKEIAARIGCSPKLVRNSLDAFSEIPKKYRAKIVIGKVKGRGKAPGTISAGAAFKALIITRKHSLGGVQADKLMEYASKDDASVRHMHTVGALLNRGVELESAIEIAKTTRMITVSFAMTEEQIKKIESKYRVKVHDVAYTWLEQNKELDIQPIRTTHDRKTIVVTRRRKQPELDLS